MRFDIITLFPEMFDSYFNESIIKRALAKKLIKVNFFNPRDKTTDRHRTVDDKPYGGGPGMILMIEPIHKVLLQVFSFTKKVRIQSGLFLWENLRD